MKPKRARFRRTIFDDADDERRRAILRPFVRRLPGRTPRPSPLAWDWVWLDDIKAYVPPPRDPDGGGWSWSVDEDRWVR